ncbi:DUF4244 domain-containing protein [Schaalia turicensis]|nr:DUF4244 domain-containing protein [Schaalia turicensis]
MPCFHNTRNSAQTVATAGLAGLLIVVLKSGVVKGLLQNIITQALSL